MAVRPWSGEEFTPAGRSRRCGPHRPTDLEMVGRDRPRSAEEFSPAGRSRRCGPHRPTDLEMVGRDRPRSAEEFTPAGRSRRCGPHRPTDLEMVGRDRPRSAEEFTSVGRSRRCGPHRPTDLEMVGRDRPRSAEEFSPAGESALRAASPYRFGLMVGRTGLGPPKNLLLRGGVGAAGPRRPTGILLKLHPHPLPLQRDEKLSKPSALPLLSRGGG
jgi:hypothetical protein